MSGETEERASAWTTDTLLAHLQRILDERERRYTERFEAQEKATEAARVAARDLITTLSTERARFLEERSERIDDRFIAERRAIDAALLASQRDTDARFSALEKQLLASIASAERAASILEQQAKEWRSSANEWRGAMQDRDQRLVPRDTYETGHTALEKLVDDLKDRLTRAEGIIAGGQAKVGDLRATVLIGLTLLGLVLGAVVFVANLVTGRA